MTNINFYYAQVRKHQQFKKQLRLIKFKAVLLTVLTVLTVIFLDVVLALHNFKGV